MVPLLCLSTILLIWVPFLPETRIFFLHKTETGQAVQQVTVTTQSLNNCEDLSWSTYKPVISANLSLHAISWWCIVISMPFPPTICHQSSQKTVLSHHSAQLRSSRQTSKTLTLLNYLQGPHWKTATLADKHHVMHQEQQLYLNNACFPVL